MIICIQYLFFGLLWASPVLIEAKTIKKAEANLLKPLEELSPWQGKGFPYATDDQGEKLQRMQEISNNIDASIESWHGKWFPYGPGEPHILKKDPVDQVEANKTLVQKDSWQGRWFPYAPGEPHIKKGKKEKHKLEICDNGTHNLKVDYDPEDITANYNYLCLFSNRSEFYPNMSTESLLTEHFLPSAYVPPAMCVNESITYSHQPATNGPYRPLPAVYGTYKYLPPQRYMHNLAEGAIVLLYHPCAFHGQVEELKNIVRNCLYRHIISPSFWLSRERPLAVLSWSHSLSMSVLDKDQVGQFIRKYAKKGPLAMPNLSRVVEKRASYKAGLRIEARLITDLDDSEVCGYFEEFM